jgi:hypothetical protein
MKGEARPAQPVKSIQWIDLRAERVASLTSFPRGKLF